MRVDTADYYQVAQVPGNFTKVAIILRQYSIGLAAHGAGPTGAKPTTFQGRVGTTIKLIRKDELAELSGERGFVLGVERYIKEVFRGYRVPGESDEAPEVLRARVRF